jgi:hypothetical protein
LENGYCTRESILVKPLLFVRMGFGTAMKSGYGVQIGDTEMPSLQEEYNWSSEMTRYVAICGCEATDAYEKSRSVKAAMQAIMKLDLQPEEKLVIAFGLGIWSAKIGPYKNCPVE